MRVRAARSAWLIGVMILVFISSIIVETSLLFIVGISITKLHLIVPVLFTLLVGWWAVQQQDSEYKRSVFPEALAVVLALTVAFSFVSIKFYDLSVDGQTYHQEAIIQLKDGWNPVRDEPLQVIHQLWINHYAKGPEIAAAVLYKLTDRIEMGKVFNFLLLFAGYFMAKAALLTFDPQRRFRAEAIAILLALNPVSVYQSLSYYVDGQIGSLLLCMAALAYLLFKQPNRATLVAFCASILLLCNIKFTGVAYAGIFAAGLVIYLWLYRRRRDAYRMVGVLAIAFAVSTLLVGFNPYVSNTMKQGNPLYPLAGPNKVDIVTSMTPGNMLGMNRLEQTVISLFSKSANVTAAETTSFKMPFTASEEEFKTFFIPDTRVGGLGPLFGGVCMLGTAVLLMLCGGDLRKLLAALGLVFVVVLSVIVNPESWWARYVPQLWLIPVLIALTSTSLDKRKRYKVLSAVLLAVMMINAVAVSGAYYKSQYDVNKMLKDQLAYVKQISEQHPVEVFFGDTYSNRIRYEKLGIPYKESNDPNLSCSELLQQYSSTVKACLRR